VRIWLAAILIAILVSAGSGWWLVSELNGPYYAGDPDGTFVHVERGAGSSAIARSLVSRGVLRRELPFSLYARITGGSRRMQAGEYRFQQPASPKEILNRIIKGDVYYVSITIPEGLTARETVAHIAKSGIGDQSGMLSALSRTDWVQDLSPDSRDLEGFLFPETYRFSRKVRSEDVVRTLVEQFRANFQQLRARHAPPEGWSVREIVTLASLVEKEAGNRDERPMVASVLLNRLEQRMPLACDPTIIYALKLAGRYDGNIRKSDLLLDSPYNTYTRQGLPPGPIANPGADSLRAALDPAKTDYLFFVSRNDGTHHFSRDYKAHSLAVNRYQKRRN
jgi:UPF0755 protein